MKKIFLALSLPFLVSSTSFAQSNEVGAGISLAFDGSPGNYVDLGDVYNNLTFPLLLEAWVKPADYTAGAAIFTSDNDATAEQGLRVSLTPEGKVKVEFGNGMGSGQAFSRGYITNWSIPLNSWTHIAVSCKSAMIVTIYISGVSRSLSPTDGTSLSEVISHSAATASIGKATTTSGDTWFNGELDEIRLWKKSKSQLHIRDYMCTKHSTIPSDIIGYWNADESYSSTTLLDKAGSPEDGSIVGTISKVLSGAALGNAQISKFTSNWFDVKVTLYSPSGDKMLTQDISGDGIIVYYVDAPPVYSEGLEIAPAYYFGVYCVKGTGNAGYNMRYKYNGNNGIINPTNEALIKFMAREDDTDTSWTNLNGANDTAKNWISQHDGVSLRGEYTITVPVAEKQISLSSAAFMKEDVFLYPNPASNELHITLKDPQQKISSIKIMSESGMIVREMSGLQLEVVTVDTDVLAAGMYLVTVITSSGQTTKKVVVRH